MRKTRIEFDYNTLVIAGHTGYGNGSRQILECLERQGDVLSPGASIILNFTMPIYYKYGEKTIGHTPWESTEVPDSWIGPMRGVDDLWSCTNWSAEVLANASGKPVEVLPLPIEECWIPKKREVSSPFTFIHVGEPAIRKGGDLVLDAWRRRFANDPKFKLIFKCVKYPACRIKDKSGSIIASPSMFDNVEVITHVFTQQQMLELLYRSHCMVYPTRGEGFGLIPFEAIGTGLPTIVTDGGGTADFAKYGIPLEPKAWVKSDDQIIHPGLWIDHSVDEIIDLMLHVYQNYDNISSNAYLSAQKLHEEYGLDGVGQTAHRLLSKHI